MRNMRNCNTGIALGLKKIFLNPVLHFRLLLEAYGMSATSGEQADNLFNT